MANRRMRSGRRVQGNTQNDHTTSSSLADVADRGYRFPPALPVGEIPNMERSQLHEYPPNITHSDSMESLQTIRLHMGGRRERYSPQHSPTAHSVRRSMFAAPPDNAPVDRREPLIVPPQPPQSSPIPRTEEPSYLETLRRARIERIAARIMNPATGESPSVHSSNQAIVDPLPLQNLEPKSTNNERFRQWLRESCRGDIREDNDATSSSSAGKRPDKDEQEGNDLISVSENTDDSWSDNAVPPELLLENAPQQEHITSSTSSTRLSGFNMDLTLQFDWEDEGFVLVDSDQSDGPFKPPVDIDRKPMSQRVFGMMRHVTGGSTSQGEECTCGRGKSSKVPKQ